MNSADRTLHSKDSMELISDSEGIQKGKEIRVTWEACLQRGQPAKSLRLKDGSVYVSILLGYGDQLFDQIPGQMFLRRFFFFEIFLLFIENCTEH